MKENTKGIIQVGIIVLIVVLLACLLVGCEKRTTTHNVVDRNRHDVVERWTTYNPSAPLLILYGYNVQPHFEFDNMGDGSLYYFITQSHTYYENEKDIRD